MHHLREKIEKVTGKEINGFWMKPWEKSEIAKLLP